MEDSRDMDGVEPSAAGTWKAFGLGCAIWALFLMPLTSMMFDSPQAQNNESLKGAAWALATYPLFHGVAVWRSRSVERWGAPRYVVKRWARLPWINAVWAGCCLLMSR